MKEIRTNVKRFDAGNGFIVEIDFNGLCQGHPCIDAWLWHENYGVRMEMFGCDPEQLPGFLKVIENNLPEYIRIYAEEYMDGDDWERFANCFSV